MIASLEEIKGLLHIKDNKIDNFILERMPLIENAICNYYNSDFIDTSFKYIVSDNFLFDSTDNSINLHNIGINLAVYDSIKIFGSSKNDKVFDIVSLTTNKITVNPLVLDEAENNIIYLAKVKYPLSLKYIIAKTIELMLLIKDFKISIHN